MVGLSRWAGGSGANRIGYSKISPGSHPLYNVMNAMF